MIARVPQFLFLVLALATAARAEETIKSIGVISAIGDTITKQHVGLTVFNNSEDTENVDDWKLDEFVAAEIASQLAGRYDIVSVNYTKSDFLAHQKAIFADSDFDGEKAIRKLPPSQGKTPDAYIIVTKAFSNDYIGRTNQHLFGLGLYERSEGFQAMFVSYEVNVIDGRTLQYMTDRYPHRALDFGVTGDYDRTVSMRVGGSWGDDFAMTAEQRARARDRFQELLKKGMKQALIDFGFLPKE